MAKPDSLDNLADQLAAEEEAAESAAAAAAQGPLGLGLEPEKERNLQLILDIPLRVTVELGRTKMSVADLLNLG